MISHISVIRVFRYVNCIQLKKPKQPYRILVTLEIDKVPVQIHFRKHDDQWTIHYAEHAGEDCAYCGTVRLYSTCPTITTQVKGIESDIFKQIHLAKTENPHILKYEDD